MRKENKTTNRMRKSKITTRTNYIRITKREEKGQNAITLIALVVTIIVLLILAGIAISMLTGDNSILKKADEAVSMQEIATIEEEANLIYLDDAGKKYVDSAAEAIELSEIVSKLQAKGYTIEPKNSGGGVSDITVSSVINVPKGGSTELIVTPVGGGDGPSNYYAVVQGKYYKINEPTDNGIRIDRTPTTFQETQTLTATIKTGSSVSIGEINGYKIPLTAVADSGDTTITVKYGNITKECKASVKVMPTETSVANANKNIKFNTNYGTIEVIWLKDDGKTISETPNSPVYGTGMTPVSWTEKATIGEDKVKWEEANTESYEYKVAAEKTDSKQSRWANAKLSINNIDSYFVWIPRYAYRITYYDDQNDTTPNGYYDGWGMWEAENGTVRYPLGNEADYVEHNGNRYIVHPAFDNVPANGGWSTKRKGIWVAKYEMSRSTSNGTSEDSSSTWDGVAFRSTPGASSARSITIGNMYTVAKAFNTANKSHLMKNSEWGAVAYLAHSQYGRNGFEVDINNSSYYITGNGSNSTTSTTTVAGLANAYNTEIGAHASTTGNIYGVYDMSGGAYEYVAAFNSVENSNKTDYGSSFATASASDEYATIYTNEESSGGGHKAIFGTGKVGDATKEVSLTGRDTSTSTTSRKNWFSDYSVLACSSYPFFGRGGNYSFGAGAGVFCSNNTYGSSNSNNSFRAVLCP